MFISDLYLDQQKELHATRPDYGASEATMMHYPFIEEFANLMNAKTFLDYGCGKGMMLKHMKMNHPDWTATGYDPAVEEFSVRPTEQYDIVTCLDVMEHIEAEHVDAVLMDLAAHATKGLIISATCVPARKSLPDGRNAHITLRSPSWWLRKFLTIAEINSANVIIREANGVNMPTGLLFSGFTF